MTEEMKKYCYEVSECERCGIRLNEDARCFRCSLGDIYSRL